MHSQALEIFNMRLKKLGRQESGRFLHGVYRQLLGQADGEYKEACERMTPSQRKEFTYMVADVLLERGFPYHASKLLQRLPEYQETAVNGIPVSDIINGADILFSTGFVDDAFEQLEQTGLMKTFQSWGLTVSRLQRIDPDWRRYAKLFVFTDGVRLNVGNLYYHRRPFSTSIVLHDSSYGREEGLYEVMPVFGGKKLGELGFAGDDVLGYVTLEDALRIGKAVSGKDEMQFREAVEAARLRN